MDVERELERFVETIGEPEPPREEHRRELRRQVLGAAQSAGRPGPVSPPNKWRSIMHNPLIRWSATAAVLLIGATLVWLYAAHAPSVAWADVDGDGLLDLACGIKGPNRLYRNVSRTAAKAVERINIPPSREEFDMTYAGGTKLVMFGGNGHVPRITLRDTWEYDTATGTWTEYNRAGRRPSLRCWQALLVPAVFDT